MKINRLLSGETLVTSKPADGDTRHPENQHSLDDNHRRSFLKWSAAASALPFLLGERSSLAKDSDEEKAAEEASEVPSPRTTPWKELLSNQITPLGPVSALHGADDVQLVAPTVEADRTPHIRMVRIGNDRFDQWTMASARSQPKQLVAAINMVDRSVDFTSYNGRDSSLPA